jgi:inosine/xanthosine triphosphate pyrophosphatase family protein
MKLVIDVKNQEELKEVKNYLKRKYIKITDIQQNIKDTIEDLSWDMGKKFFSSRDELYDR